jgi:CHAT domain-containing protein
LEPLYESSGFATTSFTGDQASEMNLKSLGYPYMLHLSLHGFFMEDDESGLGGYKDNPLLHSGLILSGSFDFLEGSTEHRTLNDGVLTTFEINQLDLWKTELVFLSSCETGLGIVQNGEAIYNFQKAFQNAGARSLVMTMWTTEAEYEIEFMNLFYFHWLLGNMKKREAFIEAQRAMKEAYERPYYWGSFIYIGE